MKNFSKKNIATILAFGLIFINSACKKLVDVPLPVNQITSESAFSEDGTAISFVTGTYTTMGSTRFNGFLSLSFLAGLSADELKVFDVQTYGIYLASYKNRLNPFGGPENTTPEFWRTLYTFIFNANTAIEGLSKSQTLNPSVKNYLLGEAKFMRAYWHFYLANLYGDIPVVTTTDWRTNSNITRASKSEVYAQIINDLKEATGLLPNKYLAGDLKNTSPDRVRPNRSAALALLSRVYLYNNNYADAADVATQVINSTDFSLPSLNTAFLRNSPEVIWSIQSTDASRNTQEAQLFLLSGPPTTNLLNPFFINPDLLNAFEAGDPRRTSWIDSFPASGTSYYYPTKYKAEDTGGSVQTEYSVQLRLGEVYLNRAEAYARGGKIQECINDLNLVRQRARGGLPATVLPDYTLSMTQQQAIDACLRERRVELFTELGHRWMDLKRTNTVDQVMSIAAAGKGTTWNPNWALYPIPNNDILQNPGLAGHQNPGY